MSGHLKITLPPLHPGQLEVERDPARFKVLACGRRWGKTRLGSALCIETALKGGRAWWVAPSYPVASVGWRGIKGLAVQIPGITVRQVDRLIDFPGGGSVQVRSADNPDSLRGEGLDLCVMDECAFIDERAWTEALRPALSDREGGALFISTPKGRNWFWRKFQQGLDGDGWAAFSYPTSSNPHIAPGEIDAAQRDLSERVFAQEYLATFLEDGGGIFRHVLEAATLEQSEEVERGRSYVIGVDWGRTGDATVFAVWCVDTRELVYIDRMTGTDYEVQKSRLISTHSRYNNALLMPESNSMGGPMIDALRKQGIPLIPFTTSNATKAQAVDALALAFEDRSVKIVADPTLIAELQAYESERLPSGLIRYSAPGGMHDDCVMAAMIGYQGVAKRAGVGAVYAGGAAPAIASEDY